MKLHIISVESTKYPLNKEVIDYCKEHDVPLYTFDLGKSEFTDKSKILELRNFMKVNKLKEDDLILFIEGHNTRVSGNPKNIMDSFSNMKSDILFSADNYFNYPEGSLQYYYWKFYPRYSRYYNYLNSSAFLGKVHAVENMIEEIYRGYHFNSVKMGVNEPYFTRYYVDCSLDIFNPSFKLDIDSNQQLLSANGGNISVKRWPYINWVQNHSFQLLEKQKLEKAELLNHQSKFRYLRFNPKKNTFKNTLTGSRPLIVTTPVENYDNISVFHEGAGSSNSKASWLSFFAFIQSILRSLLVFVINRFSIDPKRTFRFEKHKNPDYENIMQQFLGFLEKGEAFTFAHFNDGELNFIRKFLNNDHKKTWNGRIQDQYDVPLAERLVDSIKYKQKNYFLGVSCSTCAAPRRALADDLIGDYDHKIGAMVFHHNLRYLPQLIHHMKNKEMYYVANDYQNLEFLEHLGVTVKEENVIRIPFVNSHKVYDTLEGKKFPKGSMVILMCGMLAKILIRNWYELNPDTTFIAFGSTMDDFIQTSNTNYRPYPKKLPLTRNIHLIKAFLFGNKKQCVECYNI